MPNQYLRIFQQPKSAILLILGFASGLPLALTSGTLQAWMTVANVDLKTIGFFSLVGQAYVLSFFGRRLWTVTRRRFLGVDVVGSFSLSSVCLLPLRQWGSWNR